MKDLIQEGRNIQEKFNRNFLSEDAGKQSLFTRIKKKILGVDSIEISVDPNPLKDTGDAFGQGKVYKQVKQVAIDTMTKIFVNKYGFTPIGMQHGDYDYSGAGITGAGAVYIKLEDDDMKKKYSDSNVKNMVDDYIRECGKNDFSADYDIWITATYYNGRGKAMRDIADKHAKPRK